MYRHFFIKSEELPRIIVKKSEFSFFCISINGSNTNENRMLPLFNQYLKNSTFAPYGKKDQTRVKRGWPLEILYDYLPSMYVHLNEVSAPTLWLTIPLT